MEGNIAATYTLIYRFLKQQSQHKAAEAVKKAAKTVVVLHDDIEQEAPPLEDIVKEWRTKKGTKVGTADSSSEDSESSDDSSSNSGDDSNPDPGIEQSSGSESKEDDTSDSDNSHEAITVKKLPPKAAERDTSATLSSAGDNTRKTAKRAAQVPKKSAKDKSKSSESDSSDSDSSRKSSASDSSDPEPSGSSSSSSSDSNDEDKTKTDEKVRLDRTRTTRNEGRNSSESSSESEEQSGSELQESEGTHAAKKRRTLEGGAAVTTAVTTGSQRTVQTLQKREKPPAKVRERFQRVKVKNLAPELLLDNGYKARGKMANDYGERAHCDLIATRGAGFRKEKNKKKRGSYRGGEITMEDHSIRFDC